MRLRYKIWLEDEHRHKAFGDGPMDLLERVQRLGSLRQAAAEIGMSYSQAWHLLTRLEVVLGFHLLIRHSGGNRGGGSRLTPEALQLMSRYRSFRQEAGEHLDRLYATNLADYPWPERDTNPSITTERKSVKARNGRAGKAKERPQS